MANLGYIQVIRVCNQRCRFCSNPDNEGRLPLDETKRVIDDFVARGYDGIILTGGEPTLYEHLHDALRYARERGIAARMITNGQKTSDRAYLESLVAAGLQHLHVSVHTSDPKLQAFLTNKEDSLEHIVRTLDNVGQMGLACNVNMTICKHNAGQLDRLVVWLTKRWPFLQHFVWNHLDPSANRCEQNPDVIPRLHDIEVSLFRAMRYLDRAGRTFRAERIPLCYMADFAYASTETRKIVKSEERIVHFLDSKGMVHQQNFDHQKAAACQVCRLSPICAGLYEMDKFYPAEELSPVFLDPEPIIQRIRTSER